MSTDLLVAPSIGYHDLLARLPPAVHVATSFVPRAEDYLITTTEHWPRPEPAKPLWKFPLPHVLLIDRCNNTLWMGQASPHHLLHRQAFSPEEAIFEHFGLQGSIVHFGVAFQKQGFTLYESLYGDPENLLGPFQPDVDHGTWDECGLVRTGLEDVAHDRCRTCGRP